MYAGYFGLQQTPFSIAPHPRYLLMSERHREALALLLYGVQGGGGFVLLTGEVGAGKTTVCRCFLEQIPENCRVAYIFNPKLTVGDLLKTICHEFQLEVRHEGIGPATIKDYLDPLNEYLLRSHAAGQRNVLIIDEAQNLTPHVLEQLRLLTNLETNERKLLQIVLIGQPELRAVLAQPELEQLANLKKRVRQYLRERRRLGFQLRSMGYALRGFADYVDKLQPSGALTVDLMAEWAKCDRAASKDPRTWARRLKILRPFMRWLQQFESGTEVPDDAIFGRAGERLAPHIFSEREIVDRLAAARRLEPDLRGVTYETLFGLLAATGLRVSEAVGLSNSDVDLKTGMLTVQRTKFAKSRQVK